MEVAPEPKPKSPYIPHPYAPTQGEILGQVHSDLARTAQLKANIVGEGVGTRRHRLAQPQQHHTQAAAQPPSDVGSSTDEAQPPEEVSSTDEEPPASQA